MSRHKAAVHHRAAMADRLLVSMVGLLSNSTVVVVMVVLSKATVSSREDMAVHLNSSSSMANSKEAMVVHLSSNNNNTANDLLNRVAILLKVKAVTLPREAKEATVLLHHLATSLRGVNGESERVDCAQNIHLAAVFAQTKKMRLSGSVRIDIRYVPSVATMEIR